MAKFCVHERHGGICEKTGGYCNIGACPYEDLQECDYIEPCVHGCAIIREAADKIEKLNDFTNSQCARLLIENQKLQAAIPRWISVEERLPEFEQAVLVIASGKPHEYITLDHAFMTAVRYESDGWVLDEFPEFETPEITYWMPVPKLPV